MAETLAAIGLASNILQFLETGIKLFNLTRARYKSHSGLSSADEDLANDAESLRKLARIIQDSDAALDTSRVAAVDAKLYEISKSCVDVANDLINTLALFGVVPGKTTRWERFWKALRREFKSPEVQRIETKLEKLREDLILHLTATSSTQSSLIIDILRDLKDRNAILEANTTSKLDSIYELLRKIQPSDEDGIINLKSELDRFKTEASRTRKQQTLLKNIVCKSQWDSMSNLDPWSISEPTWDYEELFSAFELLATQTSLPLKFCFFIDGLDEYTAGGKRYKGTFSELLNPLKALASSDSIKICASSRPWNAFNNFFNTVGTIQGKLQLEDLTKEDIELYIKSELGGNTHFCELSQKDDRCRQIPKIISERAQGVFLWVFLVVRSLKRGLSERDNLSDLQRRLDELPDDLEDYFRHMLESIESVYWDQTSRIFRVIVDAGQSLPLLGFDFLEKEWTDPDYAIKMGVYPWLTKQITKTCEQLKTRLNARCRDLLYITENPSESGLLQFQVDFLHRTVRDFFLNTTVMSDIMKQRSTVDFDPRLSLCRIMLGLSKAMYQQAPASRLYDEVFTCVHSLMYYARQIEESHIGMCESDEPYGSNDELVKVFAILDDLDRAHSRRFEYLGYHWMNIKDPSRGVTPNRKSSFLAGAIEARLSMYVEDQLRKDTTQLQDMNTHALLDFALRPYIRAPLRMQNLEQGPVLPVVKLLLELQADPNIRIDGIGRTPWELFLISCSEQQSKGLEPEAIKTIGETIIVMVSYGANLNCEIEVEEGWVRALDVVRRIGLSPYQIEQIEQMQRKELRKAEGKEGSIFSQIFSFLF
ncbi:hypothetical protein ACKLNR_014167 [Fusarium oxysporum f. sp. zingiberi]